MLERSKLAYGNLGSPYINKLLPRHESFEIDAVACGSAQPATLF
jgi:hypothetical protein